MCACALSYCLTVVRHIMRRRGKSLVITDFPGSAFFSFLPVYFKLLLFWLWIISATNCQKWIICKVSVCASREWTRATLPDAGVQPAAVPEGPPSPTSASPVTHGDRQERQPARTRTHTHTPSLVRVCVAPTPSGNRALTLGRWGKR